MIVSFHHQNKTKRERKRERERERERERMRPTTKTNRERARAKQQHTHTQTQTHTHTQSHLPSKQKVNYYLSTRWGNRTHGRRAKETMPFITKGKKNDHIIPLSTQRERGRSCPTTNKEREGESTAAKQRHTHKAVHRHN